MIKMIVAHGMKNEIGKDNELLWKLPRDMKHFKHITMNEIVVMGENTFDSMLRKPLKNRLNIVVSDKLDPKESYGNVLIVNNLDFVYELSKYTNVFIIGGESLYRQFINDTSVLFETIVHEEFPNADTFFPDLNLEDWEIVWQEYYEPDEKNEHGMVIRLLVRN